MKKPCAASLLIALTLGLPGCGWRTRQLDDFPASMHRLYLDPGTAGAAFTGPLKEQLRGIGIIMMPTPRHTTVLHITQHYFTRPAIGFSSSIYPITLSYSYTVCYRLMRTKKKVILANCVSSTESRIALGTQSTNLNNDYEVEARLQHEVVPLLLDQLATSTLTVPSKRQVSHAK